MYQLFIVSAKGQFKQTHDKAKDMIAAFEELEQLQHDYGNYDYGFIYSIIATKKLSSTANLVVNISTSIANDGYDYDFS